MDPEQRCFFTATMVEVLQNLKLFFSTRSIDGIWYSELGFNGKKIRKKTQENL